VLSYKPDVPHGCIEFAGAVDNHKQELLMCLECACNFIGARGRHRNLKICRMQYLRNSLSQQNVSSDQNNFAGLPPPHLTLRNQRNDTT
jgi:hypothetical protein